MAVKQEVTVVGVPDLVSDVKKKRRRRRRKSIVSDASSTCTSSSSEFSECKPHRRRPAHKKKKEIKLQQQEQEEPLSLEEQAQYIALDCEMVGVGNKGRKSIVARVTLVGWNGETVFDEFIKPSEEVTDYRTFVSGVTQEDLDHAEMDIEICRERVLAILEGIILVGHALKNDLSALGIAHPWQDTRDTAKYEPFMQVRFEDGVLWPRKLKDLAHEKLNREMQIYGQPHSAHEDALAALDLYRSARPKWEKVMSYKINKSQEIMKQQAEPSQ
jgi:RNA exonuclease 4